MQAERASTWHEEFITRLGENRVWDDRAPDSSSSLTVYGVVRSRAGVSHLT